MVSIYLRFPLVLWQVCKKEIWVTSFKGNYLTFGNGRVRELIRVDCCLLWCSSYMLTKAHKNFSGLIEHFAVKRKLNSGIYISFVLADFIVI